MGSVVISLETKRPLEQVGDHWVIRPNTRDDYLKICKQTLQEDEYHDVLIGIMDSDYYNNSIDVPEIKKIVDCYFAFEN